MKIEYKSNGFRAVLCTGNRSNIKIHISKGKSHTNPIADKLDSMKCLDVRGTVFQTSCASIYFAETESRPWYYIRHLARRCMEEVLGREVTEKEVPVCQCDMQT